MGVRTVDLVDPALFVDGPPHGLFSELRAEGPVHRNPPGTLPYGGETVEFWSVVRHAEVQHANRDWETFSSHEGVALGAAEPARQGSLLTSMDPPKHAQMRRLVTAGFTPRMVARLEDLIVERTARILDDAAAGRECDFVTDVAYQLPMHVISDIVGIAERDRPWVFERMETVILSFDPSTGIAPEARLTAQAELFGFAQELTQQKRTHPADDVWTLIAQAEIRDDDGTVHRIEGAELELFLLLLGLAGSETTRNALTQGLLAVLDHPDQLDALRSDTTLVPTAADEMIRWASPVTYFGRTATRDVRIGEADIAAGDRVVLWYVSANRDERAFDHPFRFDIARDPNPHVSFGGGGPHYCLGANLAKKEVQVLMGSLLTQFDVEVVADPVWGGAGGGSNVGISVYHLPVRLTARAG